MSGTTGLKNQRNIEILGKGRKEKPSLELSLRELKISTIRIKRTLKALSSYSSIDPATVVTHLKYNGSVEPTIKCDINYRKINKRNFWT